MISDSIKSLNNPIFLRANIDENKVYAVAARG